MRRDDLKTQILVRGGWSTSVTVSEANLNTLINRAYNFVTGYHKWPDTEGKVSTTYSTAVLNDMGDVVLPYPERWKPDSIRILQIGGKRLEKITLEDYQIFREDQSSSTDRVFSDYGLEYYINPNADVSGSVVVWGQFSPIILSDETDLTVFDDNSTEADDAIIDMTMSFIYERLKEVNEAKSKTQEARIKIEELWKRVSDEQFNYKTKNRGIFQRIDILNGQPYSDSIKRDQF